MRHILYLTGSRADFGLMKNTLIKIHNADDLKLSIVVTGTHNDKCFGKTINEIREAGLSIREVINIKNNCSKENNIANNIAVIIKGMVKAIKHINPDLILILGDRAEMLAGAISAMHQNIPIVHIHGGERSGTLDESVRHAISKLSHFHFVATSKSRLRLIKMGENPKKVFHTGAPGLDGIENIPKLKKNDLYKKLKFYTNKPLAIFLFHPDFYYLNKSKNEAEKALDSLLKNDFQVLALMPNSDFGAKDIKKVIDKKIRNKNIRIITHLNRDEFLNWLANADLLVGNSSSGIIEAASFGIPVINIGYRQKLRERNKNVIDIYDDMDKFDSIISSKKIKERYKIKNVFFKKNSSTIIVNLLREIPIDSKDLVKINAY